MFFILSKIVWFLLSPFNVALFLLTGAMIAMGCKMNRLARVMGFASWLVFMVFGVLPTGPLLVHALESRYAAPTELKRPVHGIIALGGVLDSDIGLSRGAPQMGATADRLLTFVDLGRQNQWSKLIYSAGLGNLGQSGVPEAQMVRQTMAAMGFRPGHRFMIEDKSRTTAENARFSMDLAQPKPGQRWVLVTSAWHMPRAIGAFRAIGWDVTPYPTDYLTGDKIKPAFGVGEFLGNMQLSHIAIHEILGTAAYALTGKWSASVKEQEQ